MFIHIKCNVSIKFNNGSSIVSITATCYKKHAIREDGKFSQIFEYFALFLGNMQYSVVWNIIDITSYPPLIDILSNTMFY